jgi:retron-type reverse transcriptase
LEEVTDALHKGSNTSAPGRSGIGYKLLKWAFKANPTYVSTILQRSLDLRHHPWHANKVVIIPKPNKPDYGIAKAYQPISLMECMGKVLERIISRRVAWHMDHHLLMPTRQFGSRKAHSAEDAASFLRAKAAATITAGYVGVAILFDISRFFDHIDALVAAQTLRRLGVPDSIVGWTQSFLSQRTIILTVNDFTSEEFEASQGTPQGSPFSPLLSAIFTSEILRRAED